MKKSLAKEREQGNHRHDKNKEEEYSDKKKDAFRKGVDK